MTWENQTLLQHGVCRVTNRNGAELGGRYELVSVDTGRSKVFWGYRLTVDVEEKQFSGESRHNMISAVRQCGANMRAAGLELHVNAMNESFQESGLSANSGYGYIDGHQKAVHMMADVEA